MRSAVAIALLAAGVSAHPVLDHAKRSMHGGSDEGSGPGSSGYTGSVSDDLKSQCLQAHNDARGAYGVPKLEWDDELAASAAGWAYNIGSNMEHSGGNYGENLAYNSNGDPREMILSQWFDECPDFGGGFSEAAGHYSQGVWKATQKVGCGMNDDKMLVCQYWPAGNVEGQYDDNVPSGCINAASLPVGSGGSAPSYGTSPVGTAPKYGDSGEAPTGSAPKYGDSGEAPTGSAPSYDDSDEAPVRHGGRRHRKPKHDRKPKKQAPKPTDKDCDDEEEKPVHRKPHREGQAPTGTRPDYDDEDQSPRHGHGDEDQSPRHGHGDDDTYGSSDESPFGRGHGDEDESPASTYGDSDESPRGGRGDHGDDSHNSYGDSDESPSGHGGSDGDCDE